MHNPLGKTWKLGRPYNGTDFTKESNMFAALVALPIGVARICGS